MIAIANSLIFRGHIGLVFSGYPYAMYWEASPAPTLQFQIDKLEQITDCFRLQDLEAECAQEWHPGDNNPALPWEFRQFLDSRNPPRSGPAVHSRRIAAKPRQWKERKPAPKRPAPRERPFIGASVRHFQHGRKNCVELC